MGGERQETGALGLDCLIVALVIPQALGHPVNASSTILSVLVFFLVLCYCAVDLLAAIQQSRPGSASFPPSQQPYWQAARGHKLKLLLLLAIIMLVVILPTLVAIGARRDSAPYRYIGDSALQVEQNARFLLRGTNYYASTFFDTPLAKWWPVGPPNPALYHADELPTEVLLTAVFLPICEKAFGWFDVRLLYLLAFCAMMGFALGLARGPTARLALLAALALNPLFVPSFIDGHDDVLVLAEVLAVIACAHRGWMRATLLLLGVACATKYTVVLLVPFLLVWLAGQETATGALGGDQGTRFWTRWLVQKAFWVALPVAVIIGPFLVWNMHAYVDSTIGFISGSVAHSFPIRGPEGYGFATFVLQGGLVHSAQDYFPFGLLQLAGSLPLLGVLLRRQWRDNTLAAVLGGYAVVFLIVSYLSRFFHGTHLAYGVALFAAAYVLGLPATAEAGGEARATAKSQSGSQSVGRLLAGTTHVQLDIIVLLLLVPQVLARPVGRAEQLTAAMALLFLTLYVVAAALAGSPALPLAGARSLDAEAEDGGKHSSPSSTVIGTHRLPRAQRRAARVQNALLVAMIGFLVVWPTVYGTVARHHSKPYNYIHDAAMQLEYAAGFLLQGKNFYTQNYLHTAMVHWYSSPAMAQALYYTDSLPLGVLLTVPVKLFAQATVGWFDERFLFLPFVLMAGWFVWRLGGPLDVRRARVGAVFLGPFFVPTIIYGQNDILVVVALGGALFALRTGRSSLGALLVGVALASKHTAFFIYPLFLVYLWGIAPESFAREKLGYVWRQGRWSLLAPALTIGPFLLWNAPAFWANNVSFLAGTIPHSYPIRGVGAYGFGALVLLGKLVASPQSYFPFSILQALVLSPLFVMLCRALIKNASIPLLASSYAVVLGFGYFFSRFLQDSGVGYIVLMIALACLYPSRGHDASHSGTLVSSQS